VMSRNTTEAKFITLFYGLLDVDRKTLQRVATVSDFLTVGFSHDVLTLGIPPAN
jgi:hypothetical protein